MIRIEQNSAIIATKKASISNFQLEMKKHPGNE